MALRGVLAAVWCFVSLGLSNSTAEVNAGNFTSGVMAMQKDPTTRHADAIC